jgi:hypothetical protein
MGIGDVEQAGLRLGEVLDEQRDVLLIVDDVWRARTCGLSACRHVPVHPAGHHAPAGLLPNAVARRSVKVDQFSHGQARAVLTAADPSLGRVDLGQLVELTGRWPLLVRLASSRLAAGASIKASIEILKAR